MNKADATMGTKVKYFPILTNRALFTEHEITSEQWQVGGENVVKISDKTGCVSIEHLEPI